MFNFTADHVLNVQRQRQSLQGLLTFVGCPDWNPWGAAGWQWKQGDNVRNHWKQFIGERAQLNGMGLKFKIPPFWVCLCEAPYTQRLSVYIYVAILCWKCYMCGVAAGSKEYFSLSEMWKKPTFWLPHTCFPSVQETIESHFKRASSHFPLSISGSESCVFSILWEEFCNCDLIRAGFSLSWGQGFSALILFMEAAFEEILRPPSLHHYFAISKCWSYCHVRFGLRTLYYLNDTSCLVNGRLGL